MAQPQPRDGQHVRGVAAAEVGIERAGVQARRFNAALSAKAAAIALEFARLAVMTPSLLPAFHAAGSKRRTCEWPRQRQWLVRSRMSP
jgi:hypothetical protein